MGGTGTWDSSTTTHWAASSNGAGGQSVPGAADSVTFDGSSGGGTVTVNFGGAISINSLTCGAHTGTLDFATNNNSISMSFFSGTGVATRTLNMGNGTWTISATSGTVWNMVTTSGLTFSANSSNIVLSGAGSAATTFEGGGLTYRVLTLNANTNRGGVIIPTSNTYNTLTVNGPNCLSLANSTTQTATTLTLSGSISAPIGILSNSINTAATISVASGTPTITGIAARLITFTGGATFSATDSYNLGINTGITITGPSGGSSGGGMIGS